MSSQRLQTLIGKRIEGIITVQGNQAEPYDQLVLVFDDNTHFEIYGNQLAWSSRAYEGGWDAAMKTIRHAGGVVTEINRLSREED